MDELEELKRRKIEDFQARYNQEQQEQKAFEQQVHQLESVVKNAMTKEALSRYGTVKLAHPEKAVQTLVVLAQFLQQNKITVIDDILLKDVLLKLTPEKKNFKIQKD